MSKNIKDTIIPLLSLEKPVGVLTKSEWDELDKSILELLKTPTEEEIAAAIKKAESKNATSEDRMNAWLMGWDIEAWDANNEWVDPEPDAPKYDLSGIDALLGEWDSSGGQIDDLDD